MYTKSTIAFRIYEGFRCIVTAILSFALLVGSAGFSVGLQAQGDKPDPSRPVIGTTTNENIQSAGIAANDAIRPGFNTLELPANDDGSTGLINIGFTINFFGTLYNQLYVNNNGNVTFDSPLGTFTPFGLDSTNQIIIAPFFADVDTRTGNTTKFGQGTVDGRNAFGVTWQTVGCFSRITHVLNSFQLLLIDRSDTGANNFDIEFNYDQIQWETGGASGGDGNCLGGSSAHVGYANGAGDFFELPGSGTPGSFLDNNPTTGLIHNRLNSNKNGRYLFFVRNGFVGDQCIQFSIALNGRQEVPINNSQTLGAAAIRVNTATNTLNYYISYGKFSTRETGAHIHGFAAAGGNAPVVHTLPFGNTKAGTWTYAQAQEANILAGLTYINIHSQRYPNGEIRGQIANGRDCTASALAAEVSNLLVEEETPYTIFLPSIAR